VYAFAFALVPELCCRLLGVINIRGCPKSLFGGICRCELDGNLLKFNIHFSGYFTSNAEWRALWTASIKYRPCGTLLSKNFIINGIRHLESLYKFY
jgi:hypothetical protein